MKDEETVVYKEEMTVRVFSGDFLALDGSLRNPTLALDGSFVKPGIYRKEIIHRLVLIAEEQIQTAGGFPVVDYSHR